MTTGGFSTLVTTYVPSYCSSLDRIDNGSAVSWAGADSPSTRKSKSEFYYRQTATSVVQPDGTRRPGRKFRVYQSLPDGADPNAGYREPNEFEKDWRKRSINLVTWYPIYGTIPQWDQPRECSAHLFMPPGAADEWGYDDESKLLEKLSKATMGEFNLSSFLGAEGLDTLSFITDSASRLYRGLRAVRRGKLQEAIKALLGASNGYTRSPARPAIGRWHEQLEVYERIVPSVPGKKVRNPTSWRDLTASNWLEFHLAAEPLLGDIKAAAEQLAFTLNRPQKKTIRVSRRKVYHRAKQGHGDSEYFSAINSLEHRKQITCLLSELPGVAALSGVMDPEIVVWNALPLSFVVDWIYPIGNWLEQRALASHLKGTFVYSEKKEATLSNLVGQWRDGNRVQNVDENSTLVVDGSFKRTVTHSLIVPLPPVKPLGAVTSWQRAATAVALVSSFHSSR